MLPGIFERYGHTTFALVRRAMIPIVIRLWPSHTFQAERIHYDHNLWAYYALLNCSRGVDWLRGHFWLVCLAAPDPDQPVDAAEND